MQPGTAMAAGGPFVWGVSGFMIYKQLHVQSLLITSCKQHIFMFIME
jgi:hypothetical protein